MQFVITSALLDGVDRSDAVTIVSSNQIHIDFSSDADWVTFQKDLDIVIEANYVADPTYKITQSFGIDMYDCNAGQPTQSNIMYFINKPITLQSPMIENTMIDTSICSTLQIELDGLTLDNYGFASESGDSSTHTLHIDTTDRNKAGVYSGERK